MRISIRLDDGLMLQVKQIAASSGRTMSSIVEDALREMLARQRKTEERAPVKLTTVPGSGLQPGGAVDNSASLLSLMEESGDPA
jgi:hypothetical protein